MNFYFYDLETSGLDSCNDYIMQFAGWKLNSSLQPLEEAEEFLVCLPEDNLPKPEAILTHRILPLQTRLEGLTEHQFLNWLETNIYSDKDLVFCGYASINFDDRFMDQLHRRNFGDPERWQANGGRTSSDIYKLAVLTRDLRPEGINWPTKANRRANNKLSALAIANDLKHDNFHRALGDVEATVKLAQLFKTKQPKLFDYFLRLRQAEFVRQTVCHGKPFVYNLSGSQFYRMPEHFTTLAVVLGEHPADSDSYIVYDLRYDPRDFTKLSPKDRQLKLLAALEGRDYLGLSVVNVHNQPLVAPLKVLDKASSARLALDQAELNRNFKSLSRSSLATAVAEIGSQLKVTGGDTVKLSRHDQVLSRQIRQADQEALFAMKPDFDDPGLKRLFELYKARNFEGQLSSQELLDWDYYKQKCLTPQKVQQFLSSLEKLYLENQDNEDNLSLLRDLHLYVQGLLPSYS